jgi:hypothetical protein
LLAWAPIDEPAPLTAIEFPVPPGVAGGPGHRGERARALPPEEHHSASNLLNLAAPVTTPILSGEAMNTSATSRRMAIATVLFLGNMLTACSDKAHESLVNPDAGAGAIANVLISAAAPRPRTTSLSINYWQWAPSYGDYVTGTEALVAAVTPAFMRVGGYNNDANTPDRFDEARMDTMVAYAKAIGAEPIVQVPVLLDTSGQPATAETAAAMVRYLNVTNDYRIKYFSIGNEPDLYATQGLPSDASKPAIPNYGPADYCATAQSFVAAMKAVDPAILIVGPDLSWKYQAGSATNDWLTPILQGCGDLFDIVAIHRYPFSATQATLSGAAIDATKYSAVIASVRGILEATGYGQKPLALTEMNVAYDGNSCVLEASTGTVGSALWLADSLGTSMTLGLWTSALWAIGDPDTWSLGFLGGPPTHQPRPEYYAYLLYAQNFGPTLLSVTSKPSGVSAYASRNASDTGTEIIVVNWNSSATSLTFQVSGLASPATSPTFNVPGVSLAAIEVADTGASSAWVYGEGQRVAGVGPASLVPGAAPAAVPDAGAGAAGRNVGTGCQSGNFICPQTTLPGPVITTNGAGTGPSHITFGTTPNAWGSYAYAAPGQANPTATVTPDGNGLAISGGFGPLSGGSNNWEGFGLYYNSSSCINASSYTGVQFDFSGDLGGCFVLLGLSYSRDLANADDPIRGGCAGTSASCYGPAADFTAAALAATPADPTIRVPFTSMTGGMPVSTFDPAFMVGVQWQLSTTLANPDNGSCAANFTVENVMFY